MKVYHLQKKILRLQRKKWITFPKKINLSEVRVIVPSHHLPISIRKIFLISEYRDARILGAHLPHELVALARCELLAEHEIGRHDAQEHAMSDDCDPIFGTSNEIFERLPCAILQVLEILLIGMSESRHMEIIQNRLFRFYRIRIVLGNACMARWTSTLDEDIGVFDRRRILLKNEIRRLFGSDGRAAYDHIYLYLRETLAQKSGLAAAVGSEQLGMRLMYGPDIPLAFAVPHKVDGLH